MNRPRKEILEEAIIKALGNITIVAKSFGVARNTVMNWIVKYDMQNAIQEARETRLDFAESQLDQKMQKGDITALIFFLKTQGGSRGYQSIKEDNDKHTIIIQNGKELPDDE